jgi:predicted ATPase with chaperone activity
MGRVLKVARTVADLGGSSAVAVEHVAEALLFRLEPDAADASTPDSLR